MIEIEVNHSDRLGPPRNQGRRPTCLAFAASDLNAFAHSTGHLSVEYLCHFAAKAIDGWQPGDGFTTDQVFTALTRPGQPSEEIYPYQIGTPDAPLLAPPANLLPLYSGNVREQDLTLEDVLTQVRVARAVCIVIAVTKSLFYPQDGIVEFDPFVIPNQFHALLAVGVGAHTQSHETHVLLRNSWGAGWGRQGHAWVSERYLRLHMQEGFSV
ncbi:C1 family peptidase [Burkholderia sp. 9120]|uniref:C1 family peptidase n=1 Tax=Burkholderia sp. 9120 TaxID=1500897 RepID=UPI000556A82F|nr:C1 family peptidase [Burkholderia sp. 9120]